MRILSFSSRTAKEIIRDPLNLIFGIGFPVVILCLLQAIQYNIPVPLFEIERLAPGIAVFGLSFMSLFSSVLIAKDRSTAFLERLYTTPMRPYEFIIGYTLPLLPMAFLQSAVCFGVSMLFGLKFNTGLLLALVLSVPVAVFFIAVGLLFGSILSDKAVGGVCGALLTNLCAFLSGAWFDISLIGGIFEKIAMLLPFANATELLRAAISGDLGAHGGNLLAVLLWALGTLALAIFVFLGSMKKTAK